MVATGAPGTDVPLPVVGYLFMFGLFLSVILWISTGLRFFGEVFYDANEWFMSLRQGK